MKASPTSRRKDVIPVWPGQPIGDSLTHFWTDISDILQRLCDGALWPEGTDTIVGEDDIPVLCRPCRDIYLEDRLGGLMMLEFSLDPLTLTNRAGAPNNGVATPNNGVATINIPEAITVPRVSMSTFARFYAARGAGQLALVRRAKLQLLRPDITGGGFYSALRQFLRANHWRTRDASYLENGALDRFLTSQKDNKKPHYKDIVSHYIEQWNRRDAEFFMVERYDYDLGGLTIRVNPEVGMRNDDGERVLKLWLDTQQLPRQIRQVSEYLMSEAQRACPAWDRGWQCGMWDVRRNSIPFPLSVPPRMDLLVSAQVAAFLNMWNSLDAERGELDEDP